ncbi:hypothetical protein LXA43DRAFT_1046433, partial [Ganoderma leucocontextum]
TTTCTSHSSVDSAKPIVDITELSDTLHTLLILIYPVPKPPPGSFALIEAALVAAQKYELELPIQALKNDLRAPTNVLGDSTLRVWAIACRLRLEDVAKYAASYLTLLGFDRLRDPDDAVLQGVSAGDYFRLRVFCRNKIAFIYNAGATFKFMEPPKGGSKATNAPVLDAASNGRAEASFCTVPYPDVLVRSSNGAEAPAHRCVLAMASPVLRDKLASRLPVTYSSPLPVTGQYQSAASPLPVLQLDEPSDILWPLLDTCCYSDVQRPEQHSPSPSLFILTRMVTAAEKYEMAHGLHVRRARWNALAANSPLDAYLVAAEAGLNALVKDAARLLVNQPSAVCTQYSAKLENAPALAYHRLLVYYSRCHDALKAELDMVKAQYPDNPVLPPATGPKQDRQWTLHPFLDKIGDSAISGADGIISATRSLLPEYIQWRSTETSLSSALWQTLSTRLENAIKKVPSNCSCNASSRQYDR